MPRTVTAYNPSDSLRTEVATGTHKFVSDEPASVGGADQGPAPFDLLLAALGSCTSMTVRLCARRKDWPLASVTTRVRRHPGKRLVDERERTEPAQDRITRDLTLTGPLSSEQRARLLDIAERCPVHRALEAGASITTMLEPGKLAA